MERNIIFLLHSAWVRLERLATVVIFSGFIPSDKLPKYYRGSNVTVLPTTDNSEGFGMVLLEAGACGKPVIGTKIGGIPTVIDNEKTGLIVPPKDAKKLANAIIKILNNPDLANKLGKKGCQKVKSNFTWEKQVEKTKVIFQNEYEKQT